MDPASIGIEISKSVLVQHTRSLLEKTIDPEKVAESVHWLFAAADHFIKVRKKESPREALIAPPPPAVPQDKPSGEINPALVKEKAAAVEAIASTSYAVQTEQAGGIQLENLSDYEMDYLNEEIDAVLEQMEAQLRILHLEEQKASEFGGLESAPGEVKNAIRLLQNKLATLLLRLNRTMKKAYGVATPNLYLLMNVIEAKV